MVAQETVQIALFCTASFEDEAMGP